MEYISAREAAEKWQITQRRVSVLCTENRNSNATMVGNMWLIPIDAQKPKDGRTARRKAGEQAPLRPFLKWAGGKGQLINEIRKVYPNGMGHEIIKYAEPFVGGGAVLFDILGRYQFTEVYISDINAELINVYRIIRDDISELLDELFQLQSQYLPVTMELRKEYYYHVRDEFNDLKINGDESVNIRKAALFIFLNKTCFNGLFRVNRKGLFNVPMGAYKNHLICDEDNLTAISAALQNVKIVCGPYTQSEDFIDSKTLVYFDPPYRSLSSTSSFTAYTEGCFDDNAQIELARFIDKLAEEGAKIIASNSDPKNVDSGDNFFDELYRRHRIARVSATRMINSNAGARGKISELLITSF